MIPLCAIEIFVSVDLSSSLSLLFVMWVYVIFEFRCSDGVSTFNNPSIFTSLNYFPSSCVWATLLSSDARLSPISVYITPLLSYSPKPCDSRTLPSPSQANRTLPSKLNTVAWGHLVWVDYGCYFRDSNWSTSQLQHSWSISCSSFPLQDL